MTPNEKLSEAATGGIISTLEALKRQVDTLVCTIQEEPGALNINTAGPYAYSESPLSLDHYKKSISNCLQSAASELTSKNTSGGLDALISAHAMTSAKILELEMVADSESNSSWIEYDHNEFVENSKKIPSNPPEPPPSGQSIFKTVREAVVYLVKSLGKIGQWILGIIQTMLTPKGWSIEGGVNIHFLAEAKLKIDFGT